MSSPKKIKNPKLRKIMIDLKNLEDAIEEINRRVKNRNNNRV